jgi:hypothetical protein
MKNSLINKIKGGAFLAMLLLLGSCSDFLDIVPDNVATIEYAFSNRANAERYLYTCYSYRPKIGDLNGDPAMGGADETWQRTPATWIFPFFETSWLARGDMNAVDPRFNFWDNGLWVGIYECNTFLDNIDKVKVDMTATDRVRWTAEAKFLKAYYHFYLLRAYGPIPILDKNIPVSTNVEGVKVWREPVDEVVEYIAALLQEAIPGLPDAKEIVQGTEAGRADKLIAYTLLADLRLWAASPLVNGNNIYDEMVDKRGVHLFPQGAPDINKWVAAVKACEDAINICHEQGKKLYREVDVLTRDANPIFQLQTTYRQAICDRWNEELIWGGTNNNYPALCGNVSARLMRYNNSGIIFQVMTEWSPTLKMVERYYSANGVPIDEDKDWKSNSWYDDRYKVRQTSPSGDEIYLVKAGEKTVNLHYNRESRFYASIGFDKGIYFGSGYYDFEKDVKYCDFLNGGVSGFQPGGGYSASGYSAKKMHSFKDNQTPDVWRGEYFPFPIYRLADLYLMYAEAVNEAEGPNGPNSATLFKYLDDIRDRAGLEGVKDSWTQYSTDSDKPNSQDGLREIIQRERAIELAFEGKRFWDVKRWRKISDLNTPPQGWYIEGETEKEFYNVVNLHPTAITFTVKDYFFPIKEHNLYVNDQLKQNLGWEAVKFN